MRRSRIAHFLALLAPAILTPPSAFAQGINLFWNDCEGGSSAATSKTFACDANTGQPFTMVVSVFPPVEMPQFDAVEARVDVGVRGSSLPAWWQTASGQCRDGAMTATCDPNSFVTLTCPDIWGGAQALSIYMVTVPYGGSFRLRFAGIVDTPSPITPEEVGGELVVGLVRISRSRTVGADACDGCLLEACFVASEVKLMQSSGAGDVILDSPATNNWVYFNGGTGGGTCEVPAMNRTWGAIKNLYR